MTMNRPMRLAAAAFLAGLFAAGTAEAATEAP